MKRRKKITYSLTAKERKEMRRKENEQTEQETDNSEVPAKKTGLRAKILIICLSVLAVALLAFGIVSLVNVLSDNSEVSGENMKELFEGVSNPTATIVYSDGSKEVGRISIELFVDDAPYAAGNFIYLVNNGYYNDTIIHDISNYYVRFSGYTAPNNDSLRAKDGNLLSRMRGFVSNTGIEWNDTGYKLGYRLRTETTRPIARGSLIMLSGSSSINATSVTFMMTTRRDPQETIGGSSIKNYQSVCGVITGDESFKFLDYLEGLETQTMGKFSFPTAFETLKISSVSISGLSAKIQKAIEDNFESLIKDGLATSTNRLVALNETTYSF